jgi:hypothetical protein
VTPDIGLFTVNNDGSEVAAFALDHDGAPFARRPRELDRQIVFIASSGSSPTNAGWAEAVRTARPFLSRHRLFSMDALDCRSVEADGKGNVGALLACLKAPNQKSFAVYRLEPESKAPGQPLFDDPAWDDIEAVSLAARPEPTGRISALNMTNDTGTILCMNANFTRSPAGVGVPHAKRVRVLARPGQGPEQVLGEVALEPDGSFLAKVPADVPIGFETLDSKGRVILREPPGMWVRRGENRSCLGCHEPPNRSPRNHRPMAVIAPPVDLVSQAKSKTQTPR